MSFACPHTALSRTTNRSDLLRGQSKCAAHTERLRIQIVNSENKIPPKNAIHLINLDIVFPSSLCRSLSPFSRLCDEAAVSIFTVNPMADMSDVEIRAKLQSI